MASLRIVKAQSVPSECLHVGDLSVMHNEQIIYDLFLPFGVLHYVDMKRATKQRSLTDYCFVAFNSTDHAIAAKAALEGTEQFGRKIRSIK
jgi:RNA recognition motif-containing protein